MDDSSGHREYKEDKRERKNQNRSINVRDVLQPIRVRCDIRNNNEINRFLLDYGYNYVLPGGFIFWIVFLITQIF